MPNFQYEDNMVSALQQYLNIRKNVDPVTEVRRRAKNIGIRLIVLYGDAAPTKQEITAKVKSLGFRVLTRQRIKNKRGKNGKLLSRKIQIRLELGARNRSRKFTATGWFNAVAALGGNARLRGGGKPGGPLKGELINKLSGLNPTLILVNGDEGAAQTDDRAGGAIEIVCVAETVDMVKYITRKLEEAARKAGLLP